jgi:hypothetical protein
MSKCKNCGAEASDVLCDGCRAEYEELKGIMETEESTKRNRRKLYVNVPPKKEMKP